MQAELPRETRDEPLVEAAGSAHDLVRRPPRHAFGGQGDVPAHEPDEVMTLLRRPLLEALRMIAGGEITDGKSICALFLADRMVGERDPA